MYKQMKCMYFIQREWLKPDSKNIDITKKYIFQLNASLLNVLFIKNTEIKCIIVSKKNI